MIVHRLRFVPQGIEIDLPAGTPLTELEHETRDPPIAFGCRAGACGACLIEVIEGRDSLGQAKLKELEFLEDLGFGDGKHRLACQCRLSGEATVRVVAA
jgi:ferredoxin